MANSWVAGSRQKIETGVQAMARSHSHNWLVDFGHASLEFEHVFHEFCHLLMLSILVKPKKRSKVSTT